MKGPAWAPPIPTASGSRGRNIVPTGIFVLLLLAPLASTFVGQGYLLSLLTRALILGLAAMSLDLMLGFGGMVSFGHAAFIGIGAYAVAILSSHGLADLAVQVPTTLGAAALFGLATGVLAVRTRGVHFIMITLAFGQMLFFLATSLAAYGGDDGLTLGARSTVLGWPLLKGDLSLYYVTLGLLAAAYFLSRPLVASRFGRVLRGTRDNPKRMAAMGFDPVPFRLVATVLAGMMTALAGVLLANQAEFVSPAFLTWQRSGELIFMVVLGGAGTLHGAILGALAFVLTEEVLSRSTEHWRLLFGPLLILSVLFLRGGLAGLFGGRAGG